MANLADITSLFYTYRGENSGSGGSIFTAAQILDFVNRAYKEVCCKQPWRFMVKDLSISVPVTTLSAGYTAGGTSLTVVATAGLGKGRRVLVSDGSNYEFATITANPTATVLTVNALSNDYASGSYVVLDGLFLPYNVSDIMPAPKSFNTTNSFVNMVGVSPQDFDLAYSRRNAMGAPTNLVLLGRNSTSEGAMTSAAGTSTTAVVLPSTGNLQDDYYNGWTLVNRNRNASALVTDYVASTKTITLNKAITSQAAGDIVELVPLMSEFIVYPNPQSSTLINLRGRMIPEELVNNYDVLVSPPAFDELIAYSAVLRSSMADRYSPLSTKQMGEVQAMISQMYDDMEGKYLAPASDVNICMSLIGGDFDRRGDY